MAALSHTVMIRVGGAGRLFVSLSPIDINLVVYLETAGYRLHYLPNSGLFHSYFQVTSIILVGLGILVRHNGWT